MHKSDVGECRGTWRGKVQAVHAVLSSGRSFGCCITFQISLVLTFFLLLV